MKKLIVSLVVMVFLSATLGMLQAEDLKFPAPSPKAKVSQTVGATDISIAYSRPGVKGRTIWGELVPLDKIWRTGANEPSFLEFSGDVTVAGKKIAAGKYSLFTIPGKTKWKFIISKMTKIWGAMGYKDSEDVVRFDATPAAAAHQEWMQFSFENLSDSSTMLNLHWEKVKVGFEIKVDTKGSLVGAIKKKMAGYWVTPYRAANYAFGADMIEDAKKYISMSTSIKMVYWNVVLKAKIYQKAGKDKKKVAKILEKAISIIPELPEGQRKFATEAAKMLKELK